MAEPAVKEATRQRLSQPTHQKCDKARKAQPAYQEKNRARKAAAAAVTGKYMEKMHMCPYCGAWMWLAEGDICCRSGAHVARRLPPPPEELLRWTGDASLDPWKSDLPGKPVPWSSRHEVRNAADFAGVFTEATFGNASRRLNNHFAFAGIGTDTGPKKNLEDEGKTVEGPKDAKGKYKDSGMVRLAGRVYHFVPSASDPRSTVPFYVNDELPSTVQPGDARWVTLIHEILIRTHPLARTLRAARDFDAREVKVVPAPFQPAPQCKTEIAARYRICTDTDELPTRNFFVFSREGGQQWYPSLNHNLYESLHYPLIYSHGTLGWWAASEGQMYADVAGNKMSLLWYARQRLLCEPTLRACGRLLNEWLVDMFCRIDDSRLGYLRTSEGQKKLRIAEKGDIVHFCEGIEAGKGTEEDVEAPAECAGSVAAEEEGHVLRHNDVQPELARDPRLPASRPDRL
jgi:hypothetical protein